MKWTAERIARSLSVPISQDTAYPELWGFDHAVVLKGWAVKVGNLAVFTCGSVMRVRTKRERKHVIGPVVDALVDWPGNGRLEKFIPARRRAASLTAKSRRARVWQLIAPGEGVPA